MTGNDIVDVAFGVIDLIQCGVLIYLIKNLPRPSEMTTQNPQAEEASETKQETPHPNPTLDRHLSAAERDMLRSIRTICGEKD